MTKARDIASATTPNANAALLATFPHKNLIINGAMQVAQRGTTSTATGYGTVDRFNLSHAGLTKTQTQESLSSSDAPYNLGLRNYSRMANTGVSTAATAFTRYLYKFEGQDIATSGWDYASTSSSVTVSFWVRSSLAGTYYFTLRSIDGAAQNYASSFVLTANTWKKVTKTIIGDSNITVDNDTGTGLEFHVWPYLGTSYTDSSVVLDEWNAYSSSAQIPDFSQSWANTAGATFDLTGVQLEVGDTATPFEHRSYGDELAKCQRYCTVLTSPSGQFMYRDYYSTDTMVTSAEMPVTMRTTPSITMTGSGGTASTGFTYTNLAATPTLAAVNPQAISVFRGVASSARTYIYLASTGELTMEAEL